MDNRFQTRAELLGLAAFFTECQLSECLLDPEAELDFPQDMHGWADLDELAARWGAEPREVMDGLRAHARRGVIRLAVDPDNPAAVYVEALRKPPRRQAPKIWCSISTSRSRPRASPISCWRWMRRPASPKRSPICAQEHPALTGSG